MKFNILAVIFLTILGQILARDVLEEEKTKILQKIKEKLMDSNDGYLSQEEYNYNIDWLNRTSDAFLSKWIEHAEYDIEKTEMNLKNNLEWRRKNNLDKIFSWESPEYLKSNVKVVFLGFNDDSNLVVYANMGDWDVRNTIALGHRRDFVKYVIKMLETIYKEINDENIKRRKIQPNSIDGNQLVLIGNLDKFSLLQVSSIRVLGAVAELLNIYETKYPLTHNQLFFVNAPGFFSIILDIMKSIISARSFQAIHVFARDQTKWLPLMGQSIPEHLIPELVGGPNTISLDTNSIE